MINKYLLGIILALFLGCIIFYNLWDNTRAELRSVKEYNRSLESEIKRRDKNERELSRRLDELGKLADKYSDYFNTDVPSELSSELRKSCKACK